MPVVTTSTNRPRQELAIAIQQGAASVEGLIGLQILPKFPLTYRNAHLIKLTYEDTLQGRHIGGNQWLRAPGTKYNRVQIKFGDTTLDTNIRGVEMVIPKETQKDFANYFDVEAYGMSLFGEQTAALTEEYLVANAIFNTTNLGSATAATVSYTAANEATNSFFADVLAAFQRGWAKGRRYNAVVISQLLLNRLMFSTKLLAYAKGIFVGLVELDQTIIEQSISKMIGYPVKLLVGQGYINTGEEGYKTLTTLWSKAYVACVTLGLSSPGNEVGLGIPKIGGIGVTTTWEGYTTGGRETSPTLDRDPSTTADFSGGGGNAVFQYWNEEIESSVLRLKMSAKPNITDPDSGELISTSAD